MNESLLTRWSRLKHAAVQPADVESPTALGPASAEETIESGSSIEAPAGVGGSNRDLVAAGSPDAVEPRFDPAILPPIESIAADTDIRAFLAPGVPSDLARAALRRAWAADPKIRDFVGLADYDWDFNAPGSMAGFGKLEMTEELRQIAARIIGSAPARTVSDDATEASEPIGPEATGRESPAAALAHKMVEQEADRGARDPSLQPDPLGVAARNPGDAAEKSRLVVRPRHGGALPR